MKIRGRLIIAFLTMTLFPIVITLLSVHFILDKQSDMLAESYSINQEKYNSLDIVLNPVNFIYNITFSDYKQLKSIADKTPEKLLDKNYLEEKNSKLIKKDSFLVVIKSGEYYYIGNNDALENGAHIPIAKHYSETSNHLTYIDQDSQTILKETTFLYPDNTLGQVFLITNFSKLMPRWENSLREMLFAFLIILLTTGAFLTIWIYESIVRPLNILRLATMQIGAGNLDKPIPISSSDEIGQLCHDFEEMRIRLKNMVEESIASEENTREIMSSISHDLKTPITAIKGYAEGIIDGVADTEEKQKKYLQTIYAKANDITYLIDELSLFSKVERNSLAYNFISLNLDDYFTDCISDVSLDLESQNISIDYTNLTDKDTKVLVDAEQLKRVLHNIIDNAVKYIDNPDGHISIEITDVPPKPVIPPLYRQINDDGTDVVPWHAPDEFVQIKITDNGPGIATKDLPHIFERFYRADASRNSSKRGSGIGLAIVKVIISEHGGNVWAKSTEGVGSSFYFTLKKDTNNNEVKEDGGAYEQNINH